MKSSAFWTVLRQLLLAGTLVLALSQWVWTPVLVVGNSMQPTLHPRSILGLNKLAYRFDPPRRGDIVAICTGRELIVKRILGLPGEEVQAAAGVFYINGRPLAEPYVQFKEPDNIAPGWLGANRFVVAGDNRQGTLIAVVSLDRIVGRVTTWRWGDLFVRTRLPCGKTDSPSALSRAALPGSLPPPSTAMAASTGRLAAQAARLRKILPSVASTVRLPPWESSTADAPAGTLWEKIFTRGVHFRPPISHWTMETVTMPSPIPDRE